MFEPPDHYCALSLRLSEVLADIGVNERLVMKRRRIRMLIETITNIEDHINNKPWIRFNFGSQTEASTTLGLKSDYDNLVCQLMVNVIQEWSDWELGKFQFLMVQDETTSPGHCLLQVVRPDVPMPVQNDQYKHYFTDDRGRVLVRHSLCLGHINKTILRNGPAGSAYHRTYNVWDLVCALRCLTWPKEACPWLEQQNVGGWLTADTIKYLIEQGCFVVPVGCRTGVYEDVEWRISTSLAERFLMFSINLTQLRCYILMKMILKCYIKPVCHESISSFICKNVLFHCIAASRPIEWRDCNLVTCLIRCLQGLFNCVLTENCPHFMIPRNNLLAGKLSFAGKNWLVENIYIITGNIEQTLLGISLDDLGSRIMEKSGHLCRGYLQSASDIACVVSAKMIEGLVVSIKSCFKETYMNISKNNVASVYQTLLENVYKLCQAYLAGTWIVKAACKLLTPFLCTSIASVMASAEINHRSQALSPEAVCWFSAGLNSDFSSSRLKLASALYCVGDVVRCEVLLVELERQFRSEIVTIHCWCSGNFPCSTEFGRRCIEKKEDVMKENITICVRYLPCEVNCIPAELKYELFRSTVHDLPYRVVNDYWMDWAVVDSLPYLYFLQYKVYSQLRKSADQYKALDNLITTIDTEPNLCHRETALNLLGQCMNQENRKEDALRCFMMSLVVRGRNNAAKWHVCRILASLIR